METHDIMLGGQGYMVAPGSYRRSVEGGGAATRRIVQRAWLGGGLQALQGEADRFWASLGLFLTPDGSGVAAGPKETLFSVPSLPAGPRRYSVLAWKPCFVCAGGLYGIDKAGVGLNPNNLGAIALIGGGFAGDATGIAYDGNSKIYISRTGLGYIVWTNGGASFDTTATLQLTGCAWYAGSLWGGYDDGTLWRLVRATSGSAYQAPGWPLDGVPHCLVPLRDALYVGTRNGLWRVRGEVVSGAFVGTVERLASGGGADDFVSIAEYNGDLYTWRDGAVVRFGVSASGRTELIPIGLRGYACRGLAAAGGYLFAAVSEGPGASTAGLWAYDGRGWWCLGRNGDGLHDFQWPFATSGGFDDADPIVFGGGSLVYGRQLRPQAGQPGLAPGGELTTSLWHGEAPDATKGWARIGLELAWPGGGAFGSCTVALAYSLDGATFTTAGSAAVTSAAPRTVAFDLPANTAGKWLALRYTLSGVTSGTPTLVALWAEYRPVEAGSRRRAWQCDLLAADQTIRRDGGRDSRAGGAISGDLWSAWESGAALTFRDLDYDRNPVARTVRIVALEESIAAPADVGRWGESRVRVRMVEV